MNFHQLGMLLEPHACVYGIDCVHIWSTDYPERDLSVQKLADIYADKLLSHFPEIDDFRIGGWSFGGAVAVEIARVLEKMGRKVSMVFGIDSALHWSSMDIFPSLSLDTELRSIARKHLLEVGHDEMEVDEILADDSQGSFSNKLISTYKSHSMAASQYRPEPYDKEFNLILAEKGTALDASSRMSWRELTSGRVNERVIPGTHWSILRGPDLNGLASELQQLLAGSTEVA
jgi:thioesterase domain-containing protein